MECKICYQHFDEGEHMPYTINPCGHYYCLKCLNGLRDQRCPMDRGRIESKTINRAIFDIITAKELNSANTKILASLNRTLFGEITDLERDLDLNTHARLYDARKRFETVRNEIQSETEKRIQHIISDSEKLIDQLEKFEENVRERLEMHTFDVKTKIDDLKEELTEKFDVDHLKKESSCLKERLITEKKKLDKFEYYLNFKPTMHTLENEIGAIQSEKEGI